MGAYDQNRQDRNPADRSVSHARPCLPICCLAEAKPCVPFPMSLTLLGWNPSFYPCIRFSNVQPSECLTSHSPGSAAFLSFLDLPVVSPRTEHRVVDTQPFYLGYAGSWFPLRTPQIGVPILPSRYNDRLCQQAASS